MPEANFDFNIIRIQPSVITYQQTRSGTTYIVAARNDGTGWVLVDYGIVASIVINVANAYINGLGGGAHYICANSTPYSITDKILVYNNMVLEGSGWNTILRLADGQNGEVIMNADYATTGNTYFIIRDLQVDGNRANQTLANTIGIELRKASYFEVTNCHVHDCYYDCMGCWDGSHDGIFKNNVCHGSSVNNVIFVEYFAAGADVYNIIIEGNITYDSAGPGINLQGASGNELYRITVINNVSYSNASDGIRLINCRGCTITGNIVYNNTQYGILLENNVQLSTVTANIAHGNPGSGIGVYSATTKLNTVSANVCFNNVASGIIVWSAVYNTVESNICYHNTTYGIRLRTSANNNTISSNICYDEPAAVQQVGIATEQASNNNFIISNTCTGHTATGIENAVWGGGVGNVILHNRLGGNTAGPIADSGTDTIYDVLTLPFVDGTASITTDGAPKGWSVAAAAEFAIAYGVMPPECQQVMKITVWAVGLAAPGALNQMLIDLAANGAQPDEVYTGEAIAVNSKESNETAFAINDIATWTFTPADDADIGHLVAGDCLEIKLIYRAAGAPDIATNALLRCVQIHYV